MNARLKRILIRFFKIIFIIYVAGGIILYFIQDRIIFHPTPLSRDHKFSFDQPFEEVNIPYEKNNLSLLKFNPAAEKKGIVLFFHGNMENVEHYKQYPSFFTSRGYACWMADYPGFGKSTGKRNEDHIYKQAALVYEMAALKTASSHIIIYGKSIGTGVASWLAASYPCRQVILETPYESMHALARHNFPIYPVKYMMRYKFPVSDYLKKVRTPISILHGTSDEVIPFDQAWKLFQENPAINFVRFENGHHNDLSGFPLFSKTLDSLLSNKDR